MKVSSSRDTGPTNPVSAIKPSSAVDSSITSCVPTISLRRFMMSARDPATSPKSRKGAVLADCTSATISADGVSVAITQAAMAACMV